MHSNSHYEISSEEIRAVRAARRKARYQPPASRDVPPPHSPRHRVARKVAIRWNTVWSTLLMAGAVVLSIFFLTIGSLVLADYRWIQSQVQDKEEQYAALQKQREIGKQRLAVLTSPKGREQLLLEHGYLKPGDRFLLFPTTPEEQRAAAIPKNDLSPHPPSLEVGEANDSAWQRASRALGRLWQRFGGEENSPVNPSG